MNDASWAQMIQAEASNPFFLALKEHGALVLVAKARDILDRLPAERLALPAEEDERISRYIGEDDRCARRAAHGLVRHCLGVLLGHPPQDLHFIRDDKGRPFLDGADKIDFNLSHGGSWVAVAISNAGRIGVDVQEGSETFEWRAIGRAFLHEDEIASIERLAPAAQANAALELWCLKEAFLKASGEGLATPPQHLYPRRAGREWLLSHKGYELKAAALALPCGSYAAFASELAAPPPAILL